MKSGGMSLKVSILRTAHYGKLLFKIPTIVSGAEEAMTDRQKDSDRLARELRERPKAVINPDLAKLVTNHSEVNDVIKRLPTNMAQGTMGYLNDLGDQHYFCSSIGFRRFTSIQLWDIKEPTYGMRSTQKFTFVWYPRSPDLTPSDCYGGRLENKVSRNRLSYRGDYT
ncbi:hypothetical protein JTB14_035045 [Gonioctena quinquepunctata]|nr:hypothetical protein JTB14_035045 [Gonioctena quinquepunctata]